MAKPQRQSKLTTPAHVHDACAHEIAAALAKGLKRSDRKIVRDRKANVDREVKPAVFLTTDAAALLGLTVAEVLPNPKWYLAAEKIDGMDVYVYDKPGFTERHCDMPSDRMFDPDHFSANIVGAG